MIEILMMLLVWVVFVGLCFGLSSPSRRVVTFSSFAVRRAYARRRASRRSILGETS